MTVALADEASNGTTIASQQERTPAWKRLGLKLKHASETKTVSSSTTACLSSISLKRTLPDTRVAPKDQEGVTDSRLKKRRVDFRTNDSNSSHSRRARTSEVLSKDKSTRLGKKVSFTAETKLEDGGKELLNEWERDDFAYYEQKAAENDAKEALKAASDAPKQPQELTPRPQRPSDTPRKSKDALDYLTIFHRSPDSWKFNKNREVWILRHILSTDDIPTSFNIALAFYVHGLRSRQARSRLLNQCYEALKEKPEEPLRDDHRSNSDSADMDDPDRRKVYHDDAVRRFKRNLEAHLDSEQRKADEDDTEYQHWLSRRKRAEILLWAVTASTSISSPEGAPSTSYEVKAEPHPSANKGSVSGVLPKGHVSKKKNRTTVIEASSSSEEESGSSDTEEDNRGGFAGRKPLSNGTSDSSSSADATSSASSSGGSDSNSDAESAEHEVRRAISTSSSEHAPGTDTNDTWAKRPPPLTSTSSASNTSRLSISSATEETSSAASSTDDDVGDGSSTASDAQSSGSDDSEGSSNSDLEDDG